MPHSETSWPDVLSTLLRGEDVAPDECRWVMSEILSGSAEPSQTAGFLVALRGKGASGGEIAALVDEVIARSTQIDIAGLFVDTCGTGGDNSGSVNLSTMAAVAVAAAGVPVVKHGNRAASSRSGSADVLEALGVVPDLAPSLAAECFATTGITFLCAPVFHPGMRFAGPVRKELGIPTIFNVLGPLANPANAPAQVVGVADAVMAPRVAAALHARGTAALVVRAEDGMDEVTTLGPSRIWDCRGDEVTEVVIEPGDFGIPVGHAGVLDGGSPEENAAAARDALSASPSERGRGIQDAVVANAAAAVVAYRAAQIQEVGPLVQSLRSAADEVRSALLEGAGTKLLTEWRETSQELVAG